MWCPDVFLQSTDALNAQKLLKKKPDNIDHFPWFFVIGDRRYNLLLHLEPSKPVIDRIAVACPRSGAKDI